MTRNPFKEDENLKVLSAEVLGSRLYKSFGIDVEKIRHTLNKVTLTQSELVVMVHFAIKMANKSITESSKKRKVQAEEGNPKKQKAAEPTVSSPFMFFVKTFLKCHPLYFIHSLGKKKKRKKKWAYYDLSHLKLELPSKSVS